MAEASPPSSPLPKMTQIRPSVTSGLSPTPPPRSFRAASLKAPNSSLPLNSHLDTAHRAERSRRTPPRPRLSGIQSAPTSTNAIRKRRRLRYSSPTVLQTTGHSGDFNDNLPTWLMPGSFPASRFSPSPSPTPPPVGSLDHEGSERFDSQIFPSPSNLDDKIRKRIREPLTPKQSTGQTKGFVYILEASDQPGLFKIGYTYLTVTERQTKIQNACDRVLVERHRSNIIPFAARVEKLCHDMLDHYHRPYYCTKCKNTATNLATCHGEWFKAPLDIAKNCVNMWAKFLQGRPYDSEGRLHQFWYERLSNTHGCSGKETHGDHHIRHQRWKAFTNASFLARAKYLVSCILRHYHSISFWRNWFVFLFILSLLLYLGDTWTGGAAPQLHLFISLGYFWPTRLLHDKHAAKSKVAKPMR